MSQPSGRTGASEEGEKQGEKRDSGQDVSVAEMEALEPFGEVQEVRQGLQQRHIQMIALAGTIGTGLFLGSGRALAKAGPLGTLLGYSIIGVAASAVSLAIGEMGALIPLGGGIVRYADAFVDPSLAFADGWNLIYSYCVTIPAEIVAAAVLVEFWVTVNNALWITLFGSVMVLTAVLFVRVYGELEFTFAMLKIILVVMTNLMAIVITAGGGPNHEVIGFKYWKNPGPFVEYLEPGSLGHFLGFWTTFSNALYAYSGVENVSNAASEVRNPRQAIPMAAKRVFARVLIFYVITIFMVGLVVPSNEPKLKVSTDTAAQSPFVIAATRAGIKGLPHIFNAIILTSAWSAGNASFLNSSRILFGLAKEGLAPGLFLRISRFGIPYLSVAFMALFISLGYMTLSDSASTVFGWLQDLVAISTLINWIIILITYLRFQYACRAQAIDRHHHLPWAAPFQPYLSWASLSLFFLILLTSGYSTFIKGHWDSETFVSSYINIPLVLLLYAGHKVWKKTSIVPLHHIPIRQYIDVAALNPEPAVLKATGWRRLNILWS